jgi:hypothetical protein
MLVNLRALLARLIDIVLLRGGPESLPVSPTLLGVVIAMNAAVGAIFNAFFPVGREMSVWELVVGTLVPLLWYQAAFVLANKRERFTQTMTALFGVNILFHPLVAPLLPPLVPYIMKQDPAATPPVALALLFFAISAWALIVWIRIIRAAFEWPILGVIVFILGQTVFGIFVDVMLFAVPAKPG